MFVIYLFGIACTEHYVKVISTAAHDAAVLHVPLYDGQQCFQIVYMRATEIDVVIYGSACLGGILDNGFDLLPHSIAYCVV